MNISGWYLSDARGALRKFVIPGGTMLQPGQFAVFYENQFNSVESPATAFAFSSAKGDQVYLAQSSNAELTGYRGRLVFDASRPSGQQRRSADVSRARAAFDFAARVSLREGLTRMIEWYRSHRAGTPR